MDGRTDIVINRPRDIVIIAAAASFNCCYFWSLVVSILITRLKQRLQQLKLIQRIARVSAAAADDANAHHRHHGHHYHARSNYSQNNNI